MGLVKDSDSKVQFTDDHSRLVKLNIKNKISGFIGTICVEFTIYVSIAVTVHVKLSECLNYIKSDFR